MQPSIFPSSFFLFILDEREKGCPLVKNEKGKMKNKTPDFIDCEL